MKSTSDFPALLVTVTLAKSFFNSFRTESGIPEIMTDVFGLIPSFFPNGVPEYPATFPPNLRSAGIVSGRRALSTGYMLHGRAGLALPLLHDLLLHGCALFGRLLSGARSAEVGIDRVT